MIYDYLIAGVRLRCRLPFELHIEEESREFLQPFSSDPDTTFTLRPVESLSLPKEGGFPMVNSLYCPRPEGETVYHLPGPGRAPHAKVTWSKTSPKELLGEYVASMERRLSYSGDLMTLLSLESLLLRHDALLLHAAFIEAQGHAILFSGPSGIGKSTQGNLWQKYQGARILNGDRAALRRTEGKWTAWGLPYAGSSGIYRNASAPMAAIVLLEQGKENTIRRLSPSEALRRLYPELMIHRWDRNFVEKALELAAAMLEETGVWLLRCRPEKEATQLLMETLEKEGKL